MFGFGQKKLTTVSGQAFFDKEIDGLVDEVTTKRLVQGFLTCTSVSLGLIALFGVNQPKGWKIAQLGLGSIIGFASAIVAKDREEIEARYNSAIALNREVRKAEDKNRFQKKRLVDDINRDRNIARELMNHGFHPSVYEHVSEQHGIPIGMFAEMLAFDTESGYTETVGSGGSHVSPASLGTDTYNDFVAKQSNIDISWITPDFIRSSKIIAGVKGSGKSTYLTYEVNAFVQQNPNAEIYIIDPHWELNKEYDDKWFPGVPMDKLLNKIIFKKNYFDVIVSVCNELNRRIEESLFYPRDVQQIKLYVDEIEAVKMRGLNDTQYKYFTNLVDQIQDEGRKYGVDIVLSCHGLKKEKIGIDSTSLSQMNWLLFERAAYDATTKYPADFDQKKIKDDAKQAVETYRNAKCRIVVVLDILGGTDYQVLPLPLLPMPDYSGKQDDLSDNQPQEKPQEKPQDKPQDKPKKPEIDITEVQPAQPKLEDVISTLIKWIDACQNEYGRVPDRNMIATAWFEYTGVKLSNEGLDLLMSKLGLSESE